MRAVIRIVVGVVVFAVMSSASGCTGPIAGPASPTAPGVQPPPPDRPVDLTGTWEGTGSDNQGPEKLAWTLTQTGQAVSGTAISTAVNATDGTCASCHKNKIGTFSGTVSGTTLTLTMTFPAGSNAAPTPICGVTISSTIPTLGDTISGTYSGSDSCEGPFSQATFTMTRQR